MDVPVVAVVMAGGTGTRLYPASRPDRPKQFHSFGVPERAESDASRTASGSGAGDRSLLARTVDRCSFADQVVVLAGEGHLDRVREHAPGADVLVEPAARDTGPALTYAAFWLRELLGDCVLLNLPSDHVVGEGFVPTARRAAEAAVETGGLVTLGVEPTRPATEYGYVEPRGDEEAADAPDGARAVARFREKPDEATARELVDTGCYWNAGMFAWTPDAFLAAARESPLSGLVEALEAGEAGRGFEDVDPVSVDYAVMERAGDVYVVPAGFAWDDLGSWDALARVLDADAEGNVALAEGVDGDGGDADADDADPLLAVDAADNVVATDGAHVSLVGVSDLVVAAYGDRVLVAPREQAQRVREVVAALREERRF